MRTVLLVFGVLSGFISLFAFGVGLSHGNDIQLLAAGVFGTMSAVCLGFWTMTKPKDSPAGLARELLQKWGDIDTSTRERLARSLIGKIDTHSDISHLNGEELRHRLSSLIATKG